MNRIVEWLARPNVQKWTLLALFLCVIGSFSFIQRAGDLQGYLKVGQLVLEGKWIYFNPYVNTWPPFFSLISVPLALVASISTPLVRSLWLSVNLATLYLSLWLTVRVLYDRNLVIRASSDNLAISSPEVLIPLALTARYVIANLQYLQINIPLFAMVLGGLYLERRQRNFAGGVLIGCAAAIKIMPVIFVPYFLYRRKWRSAVYTALWTVLFSLSPILIFGWTRFREYLATWIAIVSNAWTVGRMNQSVFAMWDRFIGHGMLPFGAGGIQVLARSGEPIVLAATAITFAIVILAALRVFQGSSGSQVDRRHADYNRNVAELCEWSVLFIVAAIFGSVTWKAFLVILLLPHAILFAVWRRPAHEKIKRIAQGLMIASFILGALTGPGLIGIHLAGTLEMSSIITIAALLILAGILALHWNLSEQSLMLPKVHPGNGLLFLAPLLHLILFPMWKDLSYAFDFLRHLNYLYLSGLIVLQAFLITKRFLRKSDSLSAILPGFALALSEMFLVQVLAGFKHALTSDTLILTLDVLLFGQGFYLYLFPIHRSGKTTDNTAATSFLWLIAFGVNLVLFLSLDPPRGNGGLLSAVEWTKTAEVTRAFPITTFLYSWSLILTGSDYWIRLLVLWLFVVFATLIFIILRMLGFLPASITLSPRWHKAIVALGIASFLVLLLRIPEYEQQKYVNWKQRSPMGDAWLFLEQASSFSHPNLHIAATAKTLAYPLYGRDLGNEVSVPSNAESKEWFRFFLQERPDFLICRIGETEDGWARKRHRYFQLEFENSVAHVYSFHRVLHTKKEQ